MFFFVNNFLTCAASASANVKLQLSSIPPFFKRPHSPFIEYFFFLVLVQKSSVMSDSLLSPLLDEQPLEKDERKKREEKRPFCYFLS